MRPDRARRERLRIALLAYRGNPYCGGQGVYVRHLSRELTVLGHSVTVFSGQPYPNLDESVALVRVPSLDLYRADDPFRTPHRRELSSLTDVVELATMWSGTFAEPRSFARRVANELGTRAGEFDLVHDNQSLGTGLLDLRRAGWPVLASIHHPITVDRTLDLAHATSRARALSLRRWYRFAAMQARVARTLDRIITVSASSRDDIVEQMGVARGRIGVVPVGVDTDLFRPLPGHRRVPGRIMTTASADVPLKGLVHLLEAVAKLRTERPDAHLVVIGTARADSEAARAIERFSLGRAVEFVTGVSDESIVERYASASCAVVPSLYEGFSLPAIEAMAAEVPLVATRGGALPEVTGTDGETVLLVAPGDPGALAGAIGRLLDDTALAEAIATAGRARVLERFTWRRTAEQTGLEYAALLERTSPC